MRWGVIGVALLLATTAGCGGKPDGCEPVGDDVAEAIFDGAEGTGLAVNPDGQAIRADSGVYYVALRIVAADEEAVGVWALDRIDPPGSIRSVDGYAQEFTRWPVLPGANGSDTARDVADCL